MDHWVFKSVAYLLSLICTTPLLGQAAVLTRSYDNGRTGANNSEMILTPQLLLNKGLKRLKSLNVDDDPRIEAQPLYVPQLQTPDGKDHNVVFVATMANQVWAFDADAPSLEKVAKLPPRSWRESLQVSAVCPAECLPYRPMESNLTPASFGPRRQLMAMPTTMSSPELHAPRRHPTRCDAD